MHSAGIMTLDEMLPNIGEGNSIVFAGIGIRTGSLRMRTFKEKGCDCVVCGARGAFFSIECSVKTNRKTGERRPMNNWHANLYGRKADGSIILMTHDHIWPLAYGGYDTIKNSTTMCVKCNNNKADKLPTQEFIAKHGCAYDPDYLGRVMKAPKGHNPPPRVRTNEEIAEKERRRQEWLRSASGLAWLLTGKGQKYLDRVGQTREQFL